MFDTLPQAFREVKRKARKEHKCCECHDIIPKGETYIYSSGIWDGEPNSYKTCLSCEAVRNEYMMSTGETVCFGYLSEAIADTLYRDFGPKDYAKSSGFSEATIRKITKIYEEWGDEKS